MLIPPEWECYFVCQFCVYKVSDQNSGEPKMVQFTESSLDPRGGKNPGVRLFTLDANTFQPLDFIQYRLDLESAAGDMYNIYIYNTLIKLVYLQNILR